MISTKTLDEEFSALNVEIEKKAEEALKAIREKVDDLKKEAEKKGQTLERSVNGADRKTDKKKS